MMQFPPFGGGEVAVRGTEVVVRGGVAPTVQTTSAKRTPGHWVPLPGQSRAHSFAHTSGT